VPAPGFAVFGDLENQIPEHIHIMKVMTGFEIRQIPVGGR
jgi:hypothetical protein